jgi:hypothetical protein
MVFWQKTNNFIRRTFSMFLSKYISKEINLKSLRESFSPQQTNEYIGTLLNSQLPFLVTRFGSVELTILKKYRKMATLSNKEKIIDFILTGEWSYGWMGNSLQKIEYNAGFFPVNSKSLNRFSEIMIESMYNIDLLASWLPGEAYFSSELDKTNLCDLPDIEPYYHNNPWSQHLGNRSVLVIHPFANSIQKQYEIHRKMLFRDPLVLPSFQLMTLPAVQSIAGNRPLGYEDWFAALDDMFEKALAKDADVIILGCGAYGFPLGSKLKSAGKQVIHLGGSTQILFGIKGKRWDQHPEISPLYNEYWIRPSPQEYPLRAKKVENACYW